MDNNEILELAKELERLYQIDKESYNLIIQLIKKIRQID